ncbi:MAG: FkbM family methyltransferase [Gammaproteobacteria bacterium]|nr:FkbM family methyltransferase [Gammaproteobacteria bacterium]
MNILQWYLHNSPIQSGKGNIYKLFRPIIEQNNPLVCSYDENIKIEVDLHDKIQRHIFFYGCYRTELKYKTLMKSLIQPGDTVLDIGTHIGYYTLMFSRWVGNNGQVIAFEASKNNYEKLTANIHRNDFTNVTAINAAASDKDDICNFYISDDGNVGSNSLYQHTDDMKKETIKTIDTGKFLARELSVPPRLIKIDVEGHEPAVLQSLEPVLNTASDHSPHVFTEINQFTLEAAGYSPERVFNYMKGLGYNAFQITKQGKPEQRNDVFCDGLVYFSRS